MGTQAREPAAPRPARATPERVVAGEWRSLPFVATDEMLTAAIAAVRTRELTTSSVQVIWVFALHDAPEPPPTLRLPTPNGWKAAPVVADDAMLRSGGGVVPGTRIDRETARLVWDAMVANAPIAVDRGRERARAT